MSNRRVRFSVGVESLEGRDLQAAFGLSSTLDLTARFIQRDLIALQAQVQRFELVISQQSQIMQGLGAKFGTVVGGVQ